MPRLDMNSWRSILVAILISTACAHPEKAALDAEVKRLCAIDGGIRVYETVSVPAQLLDSRGNVRIPAKVDAAASDEYFYERVTHYYRRGNPELSSSRYRIIRRSDSKVLGEATFYARGGGDAPGPWHESTFICPNPANQPSLERAVFLPK